MVEYTDLQLYSQHSGGRGRQDFCEFVVSIARQWYRMALIPAEDFWFGGQPGLLELVPGQPGLLQRETLSQKDKTEQTPQGRLEV